MTKQDKRQKIADEMKNWQIKQSEAYKTYIKTSAVGLEFGLAIVIGTLLGYFIDRYWASSPYGLISGMLIGLLAGIKRLYVFVKNYVEKQDTNDK